ncbi:MAG TPA: extracellular solute-binding protein [Chloroflexota bacterium]|jgi:multiple sugar transport system substrate-binding protein|nr:extracellular solute-binding protein [Chloroflexota bacterium]
MDAQRLRHGPSRFPGRGGWTRRLALRAAGVAAGGALAASCAPGAGPGPAAPNTTADTPAKLLVKIRSGPTYEAAFKEGVNQFKQKFPKIEIDYFPEESGWPEKLLAGWAGGAGADVFQAWDSHFWRFAASGVLVNINDLLRDFKKADLDDFVKGQWNGFQIPETNIRFGLPTYINTGVLYYNKNTFRKAGVKEPDSSWTYAEYAEASKRLTRIEDGRQVYGTFHPLGKGRIENTMWAHGGSWVDSKDFTKSAAHLPEAQTALEWLHDRYWKDISWLPPKQRPAGFTFFSSLGDGLVAMAEEGMHALKDVARVEGMEFDIAQVPRGPKQRMSWITTDGWGMWSGSSARPQAWEFAKYLASVEWYRIQAQYDLLIPSRLSVIDEWIQILKDRFPSLQNVNLKGVKDNLAAAPSVVRTWPQYLCAVDADKVVNDTLTEIFTEGTAKPNVFQSRKDQIDAAAGGCGLSLK